MQCPHLLMPKIHDAGLLQQSHDKRIQLVDAEGLGQHVMGAAPGRQPEEVGVAGNGDNLHVGARPAPLFDQVQHIHLRHDDIRDDQVRLEQLDQPDSFLRVGGGTDLASFVLKPNLERLGNGLFVVDDENLKLAGFVRNGRVLLRSL